MIDGITTQGTYFQDIDTDNLELGVALYNSIGISSDEMEIPTNLSKLQEITKYGR